ncbi:MAG TPA: HEAT repeat domain-containing protein [Tepidisphaeraceae bacterium]|nr:HEAT repeat domain-containing protein [Tepidisphaeraceae bacterium]
MSFPTGKYRGRKGTDHINPPPMAKRTRSRLFRICLLSLCLALAGTLVLRPWNRHISRPTASVTPDAAPISRAANAPNFSGYAGSASCQACHQSEYQRWAASHHALAERPIDPARDEAAFDPPRTFTHGSQSTTVALAGKVFEISTKGIDGKIEPQIVRRVIGDEPLRQFLVDFPNGRIQAMEASFDPKKNEWFNVFANEDRQPGDWGHWTGRGMNWNSQCAACHNTRLRKNYIPSNDSYNTKMAEMSVSCEACHGPMQPHVQWRQVHPKLAEKDPTLPHFSRDQQTDTCAACHARRGELTGNFMPGQSFFGHYSLSIPDDSETFYADGQIHEEDYEWSAFLGSRMYSAGVRCMDCHDSHSGKTLLAGNALCMRCHAGAFLKAPIIVPALHTFHKPDSAGSQCVNCHMPQTTYMQRHGRHDHGFTTPDPLITRELNIPNACNRCHADKTADWALAAANKWYGAKFNRPSRQRARAIAAARRGQDAARAPLLALLKDPSQAFYWQAVYTGLLRHWANDPQVLAALLDQLKNPQPLARVASINALAPLVDHQSEVGQGLHRLLDDPSRGVRIAAAHALGPAGVDPQSQAPKDFAACLEQQADQPTGQLQLAIDAAARQLPEQAMAHLHKALEWDARSPGLRRDAAVLLGGLGHPRQALAQIQEACRLDPTSAEFAYLQGLAAAEAGEKDLEIAALKRAVQLDPHLARAWYNLAIAYRDAGQFELAISAFEKAEAANPQDADIPYARALLLAQLNRRAAARAAVMRALQLRPDHVPARRLLQTLPAK